MEYNNSAFNPFDCPKKQIFPLPMKITQANNIPNINIYYIVNASFQNNSPLQNRNTYQQKESKERQKAQKDNKSILNSNLKKNEEDNGNNYIIDNNLPSLS